MSGTTDPYAALLEWLFADYGEQMAPAAPDAIRLFRERAAARGVPAGVVDELTGFYQVMNGVPSLDGLYIHSPEDDVLFEWWDERELWLGSRDDDVIRWSRGRFCLGDASNVSYGPEYEFMAFYDLIAFALDKWGWNQP